MKWGRGYQIGAYKKVAEVYEVMRLNAKGIWINGEQWFKVLK